MTTDISLNSYQYDIVIEALEGMQLYLSAETEELLKKYHASEPPQSSEYLSEHSEGVLKHMRCVELIKDIKQAKAIDSTPILETQNTSRLTARFIPKEKVQNSTPRIIKAKIVRGFSMWRGYIALDNDTGFSLNHRDRQTLAHDMKDKVNELIAEGYGCEIDMNKIG